MLEYEAAVWHIANVVVALELIGAPLYHRINALRYAADFALVVFPRQLKDTALEYDVVIIIYCRKHALGMRGVVSSDLVGLHATKGGLWSTAGNRTGPVVCRACSFSYETKIFELVENHLRTKFLQTISNNRYICTKL
ncbi:MAG TPA: hypothetical protein DCF33_05425 [Saprospirales bacterium]|nr:hypothetical protein [Saprospirales bacterium]